MKKICISIDGVNGVGKTTLIQCFIKHNKNVKYVQLPENSKLEDFKWWFYSSTPIELIIELFSAIRKRYTEIVQSNNQVVIVDKGINTFMARLYATFKMRRLKEKEIERLVNCFRMLCMTMNEISEYNILLTYQHVKEYDTLFFENYNEIQRKYISKLDFFNSINDNDLQKNINQIEKSLSKVLFNYSSIEKISLDTINIKRKYYDDIKRVVESIMTSHKKSIALLALVGSCYFGTVIDNWSDIDFLIIVKRDETKQRLYELIREGDIHLGINCFSISDIYNNKLDIKNKWNLFFIQNGIISPIYVETFYSPYIDLEYMIKIEDVNLKEILFFLNRFIYIHDANAKKVIKKIIIALKIYLNKIGIVTANYSEVFEYAKKQFNLHIDVVKFYSQDLVYLEKIAKEVVEIYDRITCGN